MPLDTYIEMKEKLESSEGRIKELQNNNAHMRSQLDELCSTVSGRTGWWCSRVLTGLMMALKIVYCCGTIYNSMNESFICVN